MQLSAGQARALLASARVARLATADAAGRPHLVPVTFAVGGGSAGDGGVVYIAIDHKPKSTVNLKRLRNIAANPAVSVLADHYAEDWEQLWWARADGTAEILAAASAGAEGAVAERSGGEGAETTRGAEGSDAEGAVGEGAGTTRGAVGLLVAKYPQYAERRPEGPVIAISVTRWSGWAAGPSAVRDIWR